MSGSSNILQWNPGLNNQNSDAEWLVDAQRLAGAATGELFPSKTGNKLFYQLTTMAAALAQALADKGYTVSDADLATLTAVMANIRTADIGVRDSFRNLLMLNSSAHPTYQMDMTCDEAILENSDGNIVRVGGVSWTYDITTHLDGGTETNSVWYHAWLFGKADGSYTGRLSLSDTVPAAPVGYDFKAYVGAVYNDSSGDFRGFVQKGKHVNIKLTLELLHGTATTPTMLAVTVPPTAKTWHGVLANTANNGIGFLGVSSDSAGGVGLCTEVGYSPAGYYGTQGQHSIVLTSNQTLYYHIRTDPGQYVTVSGSIWTSGWQY
jgi:hypothetical protein